jgi:LysM repeat protein
MPALWSRHFAHIPSEVMSVSFTTYQINQPLPTNLDRGETASTEGNDDGRESTPAASKPATSNEPGTSELGVLEGRDPDLLAGGDVIAIGKDKDGKEQYYTVQEGDTLSSIAAANGTTLEALIEKNGFDAGLLGRNASGEYFSSQAALQLAQSGGVASTGDDVVIAESASTYRKAIKEKLDAGTLSSKDAQNYLSWLDDVDDGRGVTADQAKRLRALLPPQ